MAVISGWSAAVRGHASARSCSQAIRSGPTGARGSTNTSGTNYTNGTNPGGVAASDANIQILEGSGWEYPFSALFGTSPGDSRIWNGTLCYSFGPPSNGTM